MQEEGTGEILTTASVLSMCEITLYEHCVFLCRVCIHSSPKLFCVCVFVCVKQDISFVPAIHILCREPWPEQQSGVRGQQRSENTDIVCA